MQLVNNIKVLPTPDPNIYQLYNTFNSKNIVIGNNEKKWLEKLRVLENFRLSDIKNVVGDKHFLSFYKALNDLELVKKDKVKKKINLFKIMWNFDIVLSDLLNHRKFNGIVEKVIFSILPIELLLLSLFIFIYANDLINSFFSLTINIPILLSWVIIVFISGSLHELSHAIVAKNHNICIPNCGLMLLLFNVAFFVDLSGINFIKEKKTLLKVMLAGVVMNLFLAFIGAISYILFNQLEFSFMLLLINLGMSIVNCIPFFHYDGGIIVKKISEKTINAKDKRNLKIGQIVIVFTLIYYTVSQLLNTLLSTNIYSLILSLFLSLFVVSIYVKGEMLNV